MNQDMRRGIAAGVLVIGVVLLGIGLFLGFGGISKNGYSCGSAFKPDASDARVAELTGTMSGMTPVEGAAADCDDATGNRKPIALALTLPGGGLILLGGVILVADYQWRRDAAASLVA